MERGKALKYFRRFVWFLASRLLLICCLLGLMTVAFYFSMNAANIQIICKDGLSKRAQVIMMGSDSDELTRYFSASCLGRDAQLQDAENGKSVYQSYYNITGIDHRVKMNWVWCWPWEDTARATVTESIPRIDGRVKSSSRELAESQGLTSSPPKWPTVEYNLILTRENGQWTIKNMTQSRITYDE